MSELGDYIRAMAAWIDKDPLDQRIRTDDIRKAAVHADAFDAEVTRLRALMTDISKGLGYGAHIIATYDGNAKPIYTCGIHKIEMGPHGDRCPECDKIGSPRHD